MNLEARILAELEAYPAGSPVAVQSLAQRLGVSDGEILEAATALELRPTLRQDNATPADGVVERLRSLGTDPHLSVDFNPLGTPVLRARSDDDAVRGQVDAAFAALVAVQPDQLRRLKACLNPACGWAFYDTSRSRSGTWCVMEVCGARHKMSQYRRRASGITD
jgi:predicted RNA-binding Zn ribbon-like protein